MIVLIGGEKGGTGKTTLAVNLSVMRKLAGRDVLLLDADRQGSASFWSGTRDEAELLPRVPCLQKFGPKLHVEVKELAEKYDDVIVDTGGRDSPELRAAMLVADRFFIPLRPSQFDVWALDKMNTLIDECRTINSGLKAMAVINLASANPSVSESNEAREYLAEMDNIFLTETIIRDRIAFRKAVRSGQAIVELTKIDPKALAEIENFYSEVFDVQAQTQAQKAAR